MADFESLDVRGSVSWEFSREEAGGLSYFLNNVVSKSEDQVISGPVTFENNVRIKNVKGSRFFNDVDLDFISKDAILKSQREQVTFLPFLLFKNFPFSDSFYFLHESQSKSVNHGF